MSLKKIGNQRIIEPQPSYFGQSEVMSKFFRALGDSTRIDILKFLLENNTATQSEIVEHLELTQSRVSEHLKCLTWCGFVEVKTQGLFKSYSIKGKEIKAILNLAKDFVNNTDAEIGSCLVLKKEGGK